MGSRMVQTSVYANDVYDAMTILQSHGELVGTPHEVNNGGSYGGPSFGSMGSGLINSQGQINPDRVLILVLSIPFIILGLIYKFFGWKGVGFTFLALFIVYLTQFNGLSTLVFNG